MTGFAIVTTTLGSADEAKAMAHALVGSRFAACVQVAPVTSVYRWQGAVEEATEHLLVCKIVAADFADVAAAIRAQHSYEVPEIVMTPIADGDSTYFDWLRGSVRGRPHRL